MLLEALIFESNHLSQKAPFSEKKQKTCGFSSGRMCNLSGITCSIPIEHFGGQCRISAVTGYAP